MSTVNIITPAEAARRESLRMQILANPVTSIDRTGYNAALALFKQVCMEVRQLLNLPTFRGGFDEWAALAMDDQLSALPQLQILARRGEALNELITYEAKKLGIVPPMWWKECWADELEPQSPEGGSSSDESNVSD